MPARFGRYGSAGEAGGGRQRFSLRGINVTPNHAWPSAAFSDTSTRRRPSVGGHLAVGVRPTPGHQLHHGVLRRRWISNTTQRPAVAVRRSHASVHPEDIPKPALWHHLERNGVAFRNFGEGFELAGVRQGRPRTGARLLTNVPMPEPLLRNTSRNYPQYNPNISDQYRATQFIREIDELYGKSGKPLPSFLYLHLPNDDMAPARPNDGYPFTASYVADNDYALGRIVEYLSKSPWWRNMAIFVTEDDARGGGSCGLASHNPASDRPALPEELRVHRNVSSRAAEDGVPATGLRR
jgi:hypothetical protein